jgi:ribA/ribD-fused uncharacterized protein
MIYNKEWLDENPQEVRKGLLFFWGDKPRDTRIIDKACLSQWFYSPFEHGGITYPTAEHYMMIRKATLFHDLKIVPLMLEAKTPREVKALGRKVKNFDAGIWEKNCMDIVHRGNMLKFAKNESIKRFLLNTGNSIIVEASPYDAIWGIGMKADDSRATKPALWRGENKLGFTLMRVRDDLRDGLVE